MSIVKYINTQGGGRKFNVGQALKDGWGLEWKDEKSLIGLRLRDRKKANHIVEILKVDWFMGIMRVHFKGGDWFCFDHAIEQFERIEET